MNIPDELLDYPIYYASGRDGWAVDEISKIQDVDKDIKMVLDAIIKHVPPPLLVVD